MPTPFFKGQALGNDYVVLWAADLPRPLDAKRVARICQRQLGVGADGIIEITGQSDSSAAGPIEVTVWNADGSIGEVSGNGLRIAALACIPGRGAGTEVSLRSAGRDYPIRFVDQGDDIEITLGPPAVGAEDVAVEVDGVAVNVCEVDVGNPHAVIAAGATDDDAWPTLAAALEWHPRWPAGRNIERVFPVDHETIRIDIHERGVGPTDASGTGASATAAAAVARGWVQSNRVTVQMVGGAVRVELEEGALRLRGPVVGVCRGELLLS